MTLGLRVRTLSAAHVLYDDMVLRYCVLNHSLTTADHSFEEVGCSLHKTRLLMVQNPEKPAR